jgi:hypothetical protein
MHSKLRLAAWHNDVYLPSTHNLSSFHLSFLSKYGILSAHTNVDINLEQI